MSQREAEKAGNALLAEKGFNPDGTPKNKGQKKSQSFFERRMIKTVPMGGKVR